MNEYPEAIRHLLTIRETLRQKGSKQILRPEEYEALDWIDRQLQTIR